MIVCAPEVAATTFNRSAMAAHAFRRAGYEAYSMAGGVQAWFDEDRPLEPPGGTVAPH